MAESNCRLYPIYFNSRVSRSKGRRVPSTGKKLTPTLAQLSKALTSLKIEHTTEKPTSPKQKQKYAQDALPGNAKIEEIERLSQALSGCVLVSTSGRRKTEIIKRVYEELNK